MPLPKWMDPKNEKKRQNRRSSKQERERASDIGGRVPAGSGSSWRAPQDVVSAEFMEQLKYTDAASFSLRARELEQLRLDADRAGKIPRMVIDYERYGLRVIITLDSIPR